MMRHLARVLSTAMLVSLLGACEPGELTIAQHQERTLDDNHALSLVLEGDGLREELTASPEREAPSPFRRIGLQWEAPGEAVLEISTTADGQTWSDWRPATVHHLESEEVNAYVGELEVESEATGYRLRAAGDSVPTFVAMEFLTEPISLGIEGGEIEPDVGDDLQEELGTLSLELSVGPATVHSRSAWGAKAPKCVSGHSPNRITVHHTVTPTHDSMSPEARLRQIQAYHQNVQGWCDIGYHFLVSRDGRIWEGRPMYRLGTHVGNNNSGNVGISFMGTYTTDAATSTQVNNVGKLVKGIASKYGFAISSTKVKGHRNYNQTSCPGNKLYTQLPSIINAAKGTSSAPPPSTTPAPSPSGTTVKGIVYVGGNTSKRLGGATVKVGSATTSTDANGYYQVKVAAGTYTVTISRSGYNTFSVSKKVSGSETWASAGLTAAVPQMVLKGIIYQGTNTSKRIAGATVKLGARVATTDANGVYQFNNVAAGTYTVTVVKAGFNTKSIQKAITANPTWGSMGLSSSLATGSASLQGVVYLGSNSSNRVPHAVITLSDGRKLNADATGFYKFTGLPAGTTVITATKSGVGTKSVTRTLQSNTLTWGSVSM